MELHLEKSIQSTKMVKLVLRDDQYRGIVFYKTSQQWVIYASSKLNIGIYF
jgi:hypothetical protein